MKMNACDEETTQMQGGAEDHQDSNLTGKKARKPKNKGNPNLKPFGRHNNKRFQYDTPQEFRAAKHKRMEKKHKTREAERVALANGTAGEHQLY
jgi:hypothetical protein